MSRRKKTTVKHKKAPAQKVIIHPTPRQGITAYARSSYHFAESYVSLLMGVIVIIVAVLFVVSLIRMTHHVKETSSIAIGPTPTLTATQQQAQMLPKAKVYIVKAGDDLWSISESIYGTGYNWVAIAKANNLTNPSTIFAGNQLVLPEITPTQTAVTPSPLKQLTHQQEAQTSIHGTSYTVAHGDTLWDISVRAYDDGYRWIDIAKANNLANPDIIHAGNILTIPK